MTTALASQQGALNPLKDVNPLVVLQRYLNGETTTLIAKQLGVTRQGLDYYLRKNHEQEFKDAQITLALERKQAAEDALELASDALALARARELLRSAQWDLERVCKRIYGTDAPANLASFTINIDIAAQHKSDVVLNNEAESAQVIESK